MSNVKKVQLTCPKCKHEFQYNIGVLEDRRRVVQAELVNINQWLTNFNQLPTNVKKQAKNVKERKDKVLLLEQKKMEICEINSKLRLARTEIESQEFRIFKRIIKEFYGEKEFKKCIDEMQEREKAYNIADTMGIDYYSSATGKHINKI